MQKIEPDDFAEKTTELPRVALVIVGVSLFMAALLVMNHIARVHAQDLTPPPAALTLTHDEELQFQIYRGQVDNLNLRIRLATEQQFGVEGKQLDAVVTQWVANTLKAHGNPKGVTWDAAKFGFVIQPTPPKPAVGKKGQP
jgi:hypothetical protein